MNKLPEAEFEVMRAVWELEPPVTTHQLMKRMGEAKGWKITSLITLLNRLIERGFLRSEKEGRERTYYPVIEQKEYLQFETQSFLKRVHNSSLPSFMQALAGGVSLSEEDKNELRQWIEEMGKEDA